MTQPPDKKIASVSLESAGVQIWSLVEQTVLDHLDGSREPGRPRMATISMPIAGNASPSIGWIASVGVSFNARIAAYQINALVPGVMALDIQRSTPAEHALVVPDPLSPTTPIVFPSLIGDITVDQTVANRYPAINGYYSSSIDDPTVDITLWASREISVGDMLHVYCLATDRQLKMATLLLYLQDLDERT